MAVLRTGAAAAAVRGAVLCALALAVRDLRGVRADPHHVVGLGHGLGDLGDLGAVRKGEGAPAAPWGHFFNPGLGGYYTVDDFRPEPQAVMHVPVSYQQTIMYPGVDDQQQLLQSPDFSQQETQDPDYGQVTQGPDLSQETQGPDLGQVTQGPQREPDVQVTTAVYPGDDVQQYTTAHPQPTEYPTTPYPTTPYPTTEYPTTEYPTTPYPTTEYPTTTDYVSPTTWRPRPHHGSCQANPAAAGHAPGTQLICTVEVCPSAGGVKGGGVKGGGVKGGGVKGGGVKGGGGYHGGYHGSWGAGFDIGAHGGGGRGQATTLVCRPFNGCDEPVQTTETPQYTTPGYTEYTTQPAPEETTTPAYTVPEYTTPGFTIPEYTTPEPEYTTVPPPPPPPPPTETPGVKGGRHPHIPGVKGHRGDLDLGVKGGVKGGVQHRWEPEQPWGVKGVKGSANVPAYGGYFNQWESMADMGWGAKTSRRRAQSAQGPAGAKGGPGGLEQETQSVKGPTPRQRRPSAYQFAGWGHQDSLQQDQQAGLYIL